MIRSTGELTDRPCLLVLEGNGWLIRTLATMFARLYGQVWTTSDAGELMRWTQRERPACVLLDLRGRDSLALWRLAELHGGNLIVLTDDPLAPAVQALGVDKCDLLTSPFPLGSLIQRIHSYLKRPA